jgi:hypothetical protein
MFKVPHQTTSNKTEPPKQGYVLPFAPELIQFILDERKLTTYRFGSKYAYLKPTDKVAIANSQTGDHVAQAKILDITEVTFRDLPLTISTHETYDTKEQQRLVMSGYYAYIGRSIQDDDPFLVINFRLC